MNRTQIEWTTYTWNIVVGCLNYCMYCYARRQAKRQCHRCQTCSRFEPHFHPERLEEPCQVKKPSLIFVCSMDELFGPWIPEEWINKVMCIVRQFPQHIFQFLTKYPKRLEQVKFSENCWVGTSIDYRDSLWRRDMLMLAKAPVRFVSFEPLSADMKCLNLNGIDWVIIGAQTGPSAIKPQRKWVQRLINTAGEYGVPVFVKDNVQWPRVLRQWPGFIDPMK